MNSKKNGPPRGKTGQAEEQNKNDDSATSTLPALSSQSDAPPRFLDSPSFRWWGHLVIDGKFIRGDDAEIYWNVLHDPETGEQRICDVAVFHEPRADLRRQRNRGAGHPWWDHARAIHRGFGFNLGPCCAGWTAEDAADVWRDLIDIGFPDREEALRAAQEFARIIECAWARDPALDVAALVRPWTSFGAPLRAYRTGIDPAPPLTAASDSRLFFVRFDDIRFEDIIADESAALTLLE